MFVIRLIKKIILGRHVDGRRVILGHVVPEKEHQNVQKVKRTAMTNWVRVLVVQVIVI